MLTHFNGVVFILILLHSRQETFTGDFHVNELRGARADHFYMLRSSKFKLQTTVLNS